MSQKKMITETIEGIRKEAWKQAIEELIDEYSDNPILLEKLRQYNH